MLTVETIGRIRRAFLVDEKPIRQIARELRVSRKTARRRFEQLRGERCEGAYDSVPRHVRGWRRERSRGGEVFIPLWFAPGEADQFDWSHEVVVLAGLRRW